MSATPRINLSASQRVDKWLWHARFFKTRSLAAKTCAARRVRLNGTPLGKPSTLVKPGDVLTFAVPRGVRVVKIVCLGVRRGPAAEAAALYQDLEPPLSRPREAAVAARPRGGGRPTKADRRALDALQGKTRPG
jgi:ribosome-associated heat shock protein Hsp15